MTEQKSGAKKPAKLKPETWLSIANLILTAIVGIGIAIFLNYRNENVQKEIVALQAETERQSKIATLQVSTGCVIYHLCHEAVEVVNLGPAPARNLKIVIEVNDVIGGWKTSIDDVDKFVIKKFPPTLDIKTRTMRVDEIFANQSITGNNAYELSVENLPAGEKLQAIMGLSPNLPTQETSATRPITIYYQDWEAQSYFIYNLSNYFTDVFRVASFGVSTSCDNCVVKNEDDSMIEVSSVGGIGSKTISTDQDNNENKYTATLTVEYRIPKGVTWAPSAYPLYFRLTGPDDHGKVEFTEVPPP